MERNEGYEYIDAQMRKLRSAGTEARLFQEGPDRERSAGPRDYARVLYSSSFRRLQGKMQFLGIHDSKFHRNRLTHSLEVAQIARSLASMLDGRVRKYDSAYQLYDIDSIMYVQMAALAHDLGNPPFGHAGERALHRISESFGGFEGNAQTFRILHRLEKKLPNQRGLNLTKRSLLAVVKYFEPFTSDAKKFLYKEDYEKVNEVVEETNVIPQSIDCQIMDLADEIAYAAHDLEDALRLGVFTIDELLHEFHIEKKVKSMTEEYSEDDVAVGVEKMEEIVRHSQSIAKNASVYDSLEEYRFIFEKELTSEIVDTLINDVDVIEAKDAYEIGFKTYGALSLMLKKITFKCIQRTDEIIRYEKIGGIVLQGLYDAYSDTRFNSKNELLPVEYRLNADTEGNRSVVDYLSGMMDNYALSKFRQLYGYDPADGLFRNYQKNGISDCSQTGNGR